MNNNHNIKDLDLLYNDAKKLINEIAVEKLDGIIIKNITSVVTDLEEYWHGPDAIIQINRLISIKNSLIDNYDTIGNIGVYISMLVKNYRDAQNANSTILPSFLKLDYKKLVKSQTVNSNSSEVFMNNNISNTVNSLNKLVANIEDLNNSVNTIKEAILNNWLQDDENRNYALKMFDDFSNNLVSIIKEINDIVKCINTSIENYNASANKIDSMPSLASMINSNTSSPVKEYTKEEQQVLDSIKKNFEFNKTVNDSFNHILFNEVKKDLEDKGVL